MDSALVSGLGAVTTKFCFHLYGYGAGTGTLNTSYYCFHSVSICGFPCGYAHDFVIFCLPMAYGTIPANA